MDRIKGVFRSHLRERPFDFYVAFVLFVLGAYGIVDNGWPESFIDGYTWLVHIISVYFIAAGGVIMASLLCRRERHPVLALMGEMYGWLFVAAASGATSISYLVAVFYGGPSNWLSWTTWLLVWSGMSIASIVRFTDLYTFYRGLRK
jgi:hypothetical protein